MRMIKFLALMIMITGLPSLQAAQFDWLDNLNVQAIADRDGFRLRLANRFQIDNATVDVVLNQVDRMSDAYMVLRMGEMSHRPIPEVMQTYERRSSSGWGALARSLGIKPGSSEFHALKRGHDLDYGPQGKKGKKDKKSKHKHHHDDGYSKGKNKSKGKGKSN